MRISAVTSLSDLLRYLEEELEWPVADMEIEDVAFQYDPFDDLQLDGRARGVIAAVHQLRPIASAQPFGIFFLEFTASYLPLSVLRRVLQALASRRTASRNPVDRPTWEIEDLLFISASGGDARRRIDLAHFAVEDRHRAPVLRTLGWDPVEPPDRLEWLETVLRSHLRWPDATAPEDWRSRWLGAFAQRPEPRRTAWRELDTDERRVITRLYQASDLTVDALPYTRDFEWMLDAFNARTGRNLTSHEFWRALSSARKTGQLVRKER